jgi:hypothetical protein
MTRADIIAGLREPDDGEAPVTRRRFPAGTTTPPFDEQAQALSAEGEAELERKPKVMVTVEALLAAHLRD